MQCRLQDYHSAQGHPSRLSHGRCSVRNEFLTVLSEMQAYLLSEMQAYFDAARSISITAERGAACIV